MKSRWIAYGGKQILYVDFANLGQDLDALQSELSDVSAIIERQPKNSVLGLVDVRGTVLSVDVTALLKENAPRMGVHVRKAAVVLGQVTGFVRVIIGAIARIGKRDIVPFDDVEAAQDWLVSET